MNLLDFLIPVAHAQAAGAPAGGPSMMSTLLFPIILIAIMYFLMIRPQMKRAEGAQGDAGQAVQGRRSHHQRRHRRHRGGRHGDSLHHRRVADNVQLRVQKGAIANVLPKGTLKSA